ncbi:ABC transporter permease [Aerococcus urinaehominis]|uniref:ABC transporter permease n=1 Tax=Aerococcus urinaehominis TaxID=128944 RepID=A0A120IB21_9LACT|nr:branched-chain amino acid ABC transporter permease [Aerococcus urinaehominis]AMB99848.1 ABC transporter permease [Aerococcus urinaehominis]SDM63624.1 branched-chain amino acid transport system permease protein [Aerococcus urinaehominis]
MFIQQLVNGLTLGSTYAIFAIGYTLILGVLGIINMAHGEIFMFGAYTALILVSRYQVNIFLALLVAMVVGAILGFLLEFLAFRPLRRANVSHLAPLISTIGISLILENLALNLFGPQTHAFPKVLDDYAFSIGDVNVSKVQVVSFLTAIILMVIISYVINKTKVGKGIRATSENPETAELLGINTSRTITMTVMLASALGAASGVLMGLTYDAISPTMGGQMSFKGLAVVILGGLGNINGAVIGGFILGIAEVFTVAYGASAWRDAIAFILIIILLFFRPQGLFGGIKKGGRP